jgi:hypothetical protein
VLEKEDGISFPSTVNDKLFKNGFLLSVLEMSEEFSWRLNISLRV